MNNQPTQPQKVKTLAEVKHDIYDDLKEMAKFFGGWDELRAIVDILEQESKENAGERHFSRDL